MTEYQFIIAPALAAACVLAVILLVRRFKKKKQPLYRRKLPKITYPDAFWEAVRKSYDITGDIRAMLRLLETEWKGKAGKRIAASLDYLEHSRYRDYETALYQYLSDGSGEAGRTLGQIIELEVRKQRGLTCGK